MRIPLSLLVVACLPLPTAMGAEAALPAVPAPAAPAPATPPAVEEANVVIENLSGQSEVEYNLEDHVWIGRYGVKVTYGNAELLANQVVLSEVTGDVIADGNVRMRNEGEVWKGEHLEYNFKLRKVKSEAFRAGYPPFFVQGMNLETGSTENSLTATNAWTTADDVKNPLFRIQAKTLRVEVGKSIDATGATVYLGNTPVMYLPKYHRDLRKHSAYWTMTPGYRSLYGAYLRSGFYFPLTTSIEPSVHLDLYQKRGIGYGPAVDLDFGRWGDGNIRYWRIEDQKPGVDLAGKAIDDDRHRIDFSYKVELRTNLTAKVVIRDQSDPLVIRDFFETDYRHETQPKSFAEVNQHWNNWSLDFLAQPQINNFFETVERLPDVKLNGLRQQIGASPLFYESESSVGYFRFDQGLPGGTNYAAMRADTFHQILLPQTYFGWLNFVPRMGGRFTHYGEVDGYGTTTAEKERGVFNTGAEVSFKVSRAWTGVENKLFDVHDLRHIMEPSFNYVFVPHPSVSPGELPQFDSEIPSLRLLPIEYPDYNAIDSIDSQNVIRFGLRNRLQTKRGEETQNLINWSLYTDWRLNPRQDQTTFADIYSDLDFRPRSWLTFNSETRFDPQTELWNGAYHTVTITPNDVWSLKLGHRYFRGGPQYGIDGDNNTIFSSIYYKLNENWGARMTHHFEARDGTLEEQYYTVYHDFRSWTGAFTLRLRDNRSTGYDWAVAFTFQLKAFPRRRVGEDQDHPDFLLGT